MPGVPQSGIVRGTGRLNARGLILRGVVVKVYMANDPEIEKRYGRYSFNAVSCDVLTYGGRNRYFLQKVPVVAARHGLHDYQSLNPPRAATVNLRTGEKFQMGPVGVGGVEGSPIGVDAPPVNPADLDGDHVLIEFLEGDASRPFIRGQFPHPRAQYKQVAADGSGSRSRIRGVEYGVSDGGNAFLTTMEANDGVLGPNGKEVPADDDSHGHIQIGIAKDAILQITGLNSDGSEISFGMTMSKNGISFELTNGTKVAIDGDKASLIAADGSAIEIADNEMQIAMPGGQSLYMSGSEHNTSTKVGDGAVSVGIGEFIRALYNNFVVAFRAHTHPTTATVGPSPTPGVLGPPIEVVPVPPWDDNIVSSKFKIPVG